MKNFIIALLMLVMIPFSVNAAQVNLGFLDEVDDTLTGTTTYLPTSAGTAMYTDSWAYGRALFTIYADSLGGTLTIKAQAKSANGSNWQYIQFEVVDPTEAIGPQLSTEYSTTLEADPTSIFINEHYNNIRLELTHTAGDVLDEYGCLLKE